MDMQRLLWILGGLAGVLLAAGVTYAASSLSTQRIGISSEPATAGRELAPARGAKPRPTATATPRKKKRKRPRPTPTPTPRATAAPPPSPPRCPRSTTTAGATTPPDAEEAATTPRTTDWKRCGGSAMISVNPTEILSP